MPDLYFWLKPLLLWELLTLSSDLVGSTTTLGRTVNICGCSLGWFCLNDVFQLKCVGSLIRPRLAKSLPILLPSKPLSIILPLCPDWKLPRREPDIRRPSWTPLCWEAVELTLLLPRTICAWVVPPLQRSSVDGVTARESSANGKL